METESLVIDDTEIFVGELTEEAREPFAGECLCCYVARMLEQFSCDGSHRHSLRYRDLVAPRATSFRKTLSQMGACCCDCEVLLNAYQLRSYSDDDDPDPLPPPCECVRRGSLQPCVNWVRVSRR